MVSTSTRSRCHLRDEVLENGFDETKVIFDWFMNCLPSSYREDRWHLNVPEGCRRRSEVPTRRCDIVNENASSSDRAFDDAEIGVKQVNLASSTLRRREVRPVPSQAVPYHPTS